YSFDHNAPGWGFLLGSQRDIRTRAIEQHWITRDTTQNQLYSTNLREDLALRAIFEPIPDLRIELQADRIRNENYTTTFRYFNDSHSFESLAPTTSGDYSISFIALKTAFADGEALFRKFEDFRSII